RKRMEQESRTKDWAMASSINAIAMSDLDGNINYVNDAFLEMWRYDHSEEVIGRPAEAFWQDRKLAAQVIEKLFKEGFWRGEMVARREDSSIFDVEVVASMVDDDARNPICLMASFIDVTERKKAEGKLQNMYEEEKKLRRQLEHEMNKRVEFTRALAHELKTPLTPVVMSSQILCQELKDETFLRVAQNINRGAQNLNNRIDELLDLARGEVGMLQLRLEEVDVLEILKEVIEEVAPVSASRGQHLISKLPPAMPPVLPVTMADRGRVKQVVLNLLNNAFKYTPEGGKVSLSVRQEDYNLIVEVKDTGPGMEKKEQEKIFNPYHRIDTDREKLGGLGLGLALCKALVELHGGRIWVRSRVNKGSTFSFSLPIVKSSE
ncbi:MAG: PAS domain-containing sensor histidine kinase, partial [Dehalococcoidia bacterium]